LFRVSDPDGLHARPAALLARAAGLFESEVFVQRGDAVARGKSLLELLTPCVGPGELLAVVTEGVDAVEAMDGLEDVFRRHTFLSRT
jgi:phosphotransferase system HPr (HPr) family protein